VKTIIVIESVKELLEFACDVRMEGDKRPFIRPGAKLVFENNNNMETLRLVNAPGFELSEEVKPVDVIRAAIKRHGLEVDIT